MANRRKSLIEEFWEDASLPPVMDEARKELFDELAKFIDPRTYGGEGILRSIFKFLTEIVE